MENRGVVGGNNQTYTNTLIYTEDQSAVDNEGYNTTLDACLLYFICTFLCTFSY